jgi:hypothetical protein
MYGAYKVPALKPDVFKWALIHKPSGFLAGPCNKIHIHSARLIYHRDVSVVVCMKTASPK